MIVIVTAVVAVTVISSLADDEVSFQLKGLGISLEVIEMANLSIKI